MGREPIPGESSAEIVSSENDSSGSGDVVLNIGLEDRNRIDFFLEMLSAERGAAHNTILSYRHDLIDYLGFLGERKKDALQAQSADVSDYLGDLETRGLGAKSAARRLSSMRQFHRFLCSENLRGDDPTRIIQSPKLSRGLPKVLDVEEVERLFETASKALERASTPASKARTRRLYVMLELLYATGMRISELVSLPRAAVMRDAHYLEIVGKGGRERVVPLTDRARDAVLSLAHDMEPGGFLFPAKGKSGHITRQVFGRMLKDLAIAANIAPARVSPHILRHAFASHLLAGGADLRVVQTLLGHADISTTQIYTHVLDERLRVLVQDHHPLAQKSGE